MRVKEWAIKVLQLEKKYVIIFFSIFSIIYLLTYVHAHNFLRIYTRHDDNLFYIMGEHIAAGRWLGPYHPLKLSKMPMYSVFLAMSMASGLPYLWMIALCRIAAVTFLLRKSMYLFDKARILALIFGLLLLFDPIFAYALRIYRYQLTAFCFIVFTASLVALFNPVSKKQHWAIELTDACTAFVFWGFLWFSREENILYAGFAAAALILFFALRKNIAHPYRNLRPVLCGFSGVAACWLVICSMNSKYYERFIVLEKTSSPYTDVVKTFHKISDPDFPNFVAGAGASREKIMNIGKKVPLFKCMAEQLVVLGTNWPVRDYFDRNKLELLPMLNYKGIPTVSHFEWAWVDAAMACGYGKDARSFSVFYTELDRELNQAVAQGKLSFRDDAFFIGPYFLFKKDIVTVAKLLPKYYFHFLPTPRRVVELYSNLMVQVSPNNMGNNIFRNKWKKTLKLRYLAEGDEQGYQKAANSLTNKFWNKITLIYACTTVPMMHLATPAALIALILSLRRRKLLSAAPVLLAASMYLAYYLMLTTLTVASGYDAFKIFYFIPAYPPMVFTAFAAASVALNLNRNSSEQHAASSMLFSGQLCSA